MTSESSVFRVSVDGSETQELKVSPGGFTLGGHSHNWDISMLPDGRFHVILNGRNYLAEIFPADGADKNYRIRMNGHVYHVQLADKFDQLLKELGMATGQASAATVIRAPMPGMILKVMVEEGAQVSQGDPLVVLKAMKMENIIRAPGAAGIGRILVREGQVVEKNEDLILF